MKQYIAAIHKAAEQTASLMTHEMRQHAINSGWTPEAANSLTVKYSDGNFVAHSAHEGAFIHEYGNEGTPPTAAVRKYGKTAANSAAPLFNHLYDKTLKKGRK